MVIFNSYVKLPEGHPIVEETDWTMAYRVASS